LSMCSGSRFLSHTWRPPCKSCKPGFGDREPGGLNR
jgi:hypothetical protein